MFFLFNCGIIYKNTVTGGLQMDKLAEMKKQICDQINNFNEMELFDFLVFFDENDILKDIFNCDQCHNVYGSCDTDIKQGTQTCYDRFIKYISGTIN